jgi:predicted RNase H-like HicB family nuclease
LYPITPANRDNTADWKIRRIAVRIDHKRICRKKLQQKEDEMIKFKVFLEEDKEDGGYIIECPALPGCASQGDTVEEALENIKEAIRGWLKAEYGGIPDSLDIKQEIMEVAV